MPAEGTSDELGLSVEKVPPRMASELGLKRDVGLVVKDEDSDGKAAAMGLKPGDIIGSRRQARVNVADFNEEVLEAKKERRHTVHDST